MRKTLVSQSGYLQLFNVAFCKLTPQPRFNEKFLITAGTLKKILLLMLLIFPHTANSQEYVKEINPVEWVNPFIGTDAHGHTFPGATTPFGMVQLSPQTRLTGWDGCSGYHYSDTVIYGFAHTALNGTGVSDYGDILLIPIEGEPHFENVDYASTFDKKSERATPGYYSVTLKKYDIVAELTATTRVGYHRYTFQKNEKPGLIIDLKHRDRVIDSWIEVVNDREIRGMRRSSNWAKDMVWYFHMEFSGPFSKSIGQLNDKQKVDSKRLQGTNVKFYFEFAPDSNPTIEIKVGLSAVDCEGARKNLHREIPMWGFDHIATKARQEWDSILRKIEISGGSPSQLTSFYSALYRAYLQPNTFQDVDGRYRGMDKNIHTANDFTNYTVFSLWDTYRTWHPLMTILEPARSADFIKTMLNMYDKGGLFPIWELAANETFCMIGNHAISVIADAYMKGIRNYDIEKALMAMVNSAKQNHFGLEAYRKHGYIPGDKEHESVSKTLEYAYNDWCIATMAKALGRDSLYREFIQRAQYYKNILDRETCLMRPKINGGWLRPFDPTKVDWHFTEANSWQYSFYVPQDIAGFSELIGGNDVLAQKLDELFTLEKSIGGRDMKDITGLIGQYAHGNEPSHHIAYLYTFVGQPWKTQFYVRKIMDEFYLPTPTGSIGNEDCGQMSAWLIMSALGFYPVTPGNPQYVIGTPWFPKAIIHLENGNKFTIAAQNISEKNIYVKRIFLNGTPYSKLYLDHQPIVSVNGELLFEMDSVPNYSSDNELEAPATKILDYPLLQVPVIEASSARFYDTLHVSINHPSNDCRIYYTIDNTTPTKSSTEYTAPIVLTRSSTVKAVAYNQKQGYSFVTESLFAKLEIDKSITITTPWHPSYHGGGKEVLIDGLRGAPDWRLGGWQGYQNTDVEAIIDFGKKQKVSEMGAGFFQDIGSWIWMPTSVEFYGSTDNIRYFPLATVKNPISIDDYTVQSKDFTITIPPKKIQYLKIKAKTLGTIPDWHPGAGGQAFIFIDEIWVNSNPQPK